MTKAIRIHHTGGPDVLTYEDTDLPAPAEGEVRIRHDAIGVNFIDTYHRSGLYPLPSLPATLGLEAAGVVTEVGAGVTVFKPGDRVAYASAPVGAYAEERNMPANRVIPLPDGISTHDAAGMMLRGLTAQFLLRRTYRVEPGDYVLVHAAAGGVGQLLCQWASALGATVIGTAGSEEKAGIARAHGAQHVILYAEESVPARVRDITDGQGVVVVYDGVGKATFIDSLDSLAPLGMMVSFGNASGPLEPFDPAELAKRGSLFFTRPSLLHYTANDIDLVEGAAELFDMVLKSKVMISIGQEYPLAAAAEAHRALEGRKTTGSTILIP